jgi:hypothetical protein
MRCKNGQGATLLQAFDLNRRTLLSSAHPGADLAVGGAPPIRYIVIQEVS